MKLASGNPGAVQIADDVHSEAISDDAGGMDQETAIALFGRASLPAQRRHTTRKEWKARQPFVPKKRDFRPQPWSELKQPVGLPSFIP
jgi:hypothetical protein